MTEIFTFVTEMSLQESLGLIVASAIVRGFTSIIHCISTEKQTGILRLIFLGDASLSAKLRTGSGSSPPRSSRIGRRPVLGSRPSQEAYWRNLASTSFGFLALLEHTRFFNNSLSHFSVAPSRKNSWTSSSAHFQVMGVNLVVKR